MKLKQIKSGLVLFAGRLLILLSAAIILPRDVSNAVAYPIILLMAIWFLVSEWEQTTAIEVPV